MAYTLRWKNPALNANKAIPINVPVGVTVGNAASIRFTGKGAPGYGSIQQENLMRLLESFADGVAPLYPTVGQQWFDTTENIMKLCTSTSPVIWKALGGIQVTNSSDAPTPAALGDVWFQRTGSRSGTMYVYTGFGRHPVINSTIGGWSQLWPTVETIAGREEYDALAALVNQLIGPVSVGGAGALGKNLPDLINLNDLDASFVSKFNASNDVSILAPAGETDTSELKIDPTSADWDLLLAAARYATSRLDLPASMIDDISPVPFVSDGQPAPTSLTNLSPTDIRFPSLERRSNRRFGIATLIRAFTETVNVLTAAVANRYALKGINGSTGANANFPASVEVANHKTLSGSAGGGAAVQTTMRFNFASNNDMLSFLNSGGAIQLTISHTLGSGGAADTDLKNLLDDRGVLRLTADKTRIFSNAFPARMTVNTLLVGLKDAPAGGQALTTQTHGGATMTIAAAVISGTQFVVAASLAGGGALSGTTTVAYQVISDATTYTTPILTRVFSKPAAYAAGDNTGSAFLV